jgi:hypothetical protein
MKHDTSSDGFRGGGHLPSTINRTRENQGMQGDHSQGVFSGQPAQSPAEPTEKAAPSGTRIREKQSPFQTQEPAKGNPDASPYSPTVPMRTNQFRSAPQKFHTETEAYPQTFRSSAPSPVERPSREYKPFSGFSGYTPTPPSQPSPRGESRIPSGDVRGYEKKQVEAVPAPSAPGGFSSRGTGQSEPGSQGYTMQQQHQYTPHGGGGQNYVPQQGKGGGGSHGQSSSFGGMQRR